MQKGDCCPEMLNSQRVLIAEADEKLREQLSKRLLDADIFADLVADGRDALKRLEERRYAMLILDLALPDASVIIDRMRDLPAAQRPMILVTALRGVTHTLDADLVQIVLRKPFDVRQIAEIVASCLRSLGKRRKSDAQPSGEKDERGSATMR
jgi:DNA-binding response OmpR family regulator